MFKRISLTMAVVYGLIIIIAISTVDLLIIFTYKQEQLDKNQSKNLMFAEIISNLVKDKLDDIMEINGTVRESSSKLDGRVLVVDYDNKVLADNYAHYIGKKLDNEEVAKAIASKAYAIDYYNVDNKNIMIVTYPIINNSSVIGAVLVSTYVDEIYKDIQDLTKQVVIVSLFACVIAVFLSLLFGKKLSSPIEELTAASEEILKGKLDTKVNIARKDEIGKLAETFNKMSEELYKTDTNRRRFISDVSHELKTPLTSIKALIESLIEGNNDYDIYKEYLTDVNGEIDRLSLMVRSLLTVTRLEEVALKKELINISDEISSIIKLFTPLAEQHDIKLKNCSEGNTVVQADKDKLKEVLINLVDNSIKYGKAGGFVEITCSSADEGNLQLIIKDNGSGIPERDLNNIFDIFYRVDESRARETGGSGIGLYLVKKIVELHSWRIRVNSKLDVGTEFIIEIRSDC